MLLSSLPLVFVKRLPNPFFLLFRRSSLRRWEPVYSDICSFLPRIFTGVTVVHVSLKVQFSPYCNSQ
jgi:hypothetical protein